MTARLAPGHHLYPVSDGSWRHATPDEKFTRISGDHEALAEFRDQVSGLVDIDPSANVEELRALYQQRDYLIEPPSATAPVPPLRVLVDGDTAVAGALRGLLPSSTELPSNSVDEDAVRTNDVIVSCAKWLPDARWQRLDDLCRRHGTAWHRCHTDGRTLWLGPFTVPGVTPSYRDHRGRRLAACAAAEELLLLWRYLDDDATAGPVAPAVPPGVAAIAAGLIAVDVAQGLGPDRSSLGWEIGVDLRTGVVTRHPVLALPGTAA